MAKAAGITAVPYDGYLKYWKPSERFIHARQANVGKHLKDSVLAPARGFVGAGAGAGAGEVGEGDGGPAGLRLRHRPHGE